MDTTAFLIVGLVAGFIAGKVVEGHGLRIARDMIVGVIGAFLGGVLVTSTGFKVQGLESSILAASFGALGLLLIVNFIHYSFIQGDRT